MPRLEPYSRDLDYSYALGAFACFNLISSRPAQARRLLISPEGYDSEGAALLRKKCAELGVREEEAGRVLRRESKKDNCYVGMVFSKAETRLDAGAPHVVLCQIMDAGNLGTAMRAAVGFGFENVALVRPCVDQFDPRVVRASMGAFFNLNVMTYDSFDEYEREFSDRDLYPFMLDRNAMPLDEAAKTVESPRFSLVFGNEQSGLPKNFSGKGRCVFIPQSDKIDSFNLAMAVTLASYAFR
ncbi:MAG: TrmH family RNA methyltransferase, partial [Clostridia bacterium]|nr:TrmH family RNA methyltransferase [Clostridia bacterium]